MKTTSLAAILFVELSGFGGLLGRDEAKAISLLTAYRDLVDPLVAEHGGELVDATGDELLVVFGSAVSAVQCALHIKLSERSLLSRLTVYEAISFRAGIHLGEIWRDESRVYGNGINVAARVKAEAAPGQILISEDVWRQVSGKLDLSLRLIPGRHLKNIERNLAIYEISDSPFSGIEEGGNAGVEARFGPATGSMSANAPGADAMGQPPLPPEPPRPAEVPAALIGREEVRRAFRTVIEKAVTDHIKIEMTKSGKEGRLKSMSVLIDPSEGTGADEEDDGDEGEGEGEGHWEGREIAAKPTAGSGLEERRYRAATDISKGAINFVIAGAVLGGFIFFFLKSPNPWLAGGAALFGLGPALSGLKRFLKGIFDMRDVKKEESRR